MTKNKTSKKKLHNRNWSTRLYILLRFLIIFDWKINKYLLTICLKTITTVYLTFLHSYISLLKQIEIIVTRVKKIGGVFVRGLLLRVQVFKKPAYSKRPNFVFVFVITEYIVRAYVICIFTFNKTLKCNDLLTITADRGVQSRARPASTTLAQTMKILTVKFFIRFTAKI